MIPLQNVVSVEKLKQLVNYYGYLVVQSPSPYKLGTTFKVVEMDDHPFVLSSHSNMEEYVGQCRYVDIELNWLQPIGPYFYRAITD